MELVEADFFTCKQTFYLLKNYKCKSNQLDIDNLDLDFMSFLIYSFLIPWPRH